MLLVVALALLGGALWAGGTCTTAGSPANGANNSPPNCAAAGSIFPPRSLTLNPFEGLVAEDAHLYLLDAHHTPLLYINRVAVDIDLSTSSRKSPSSIRSTCAARA